MAIDDIHPGNHLSGTIVDRFIVDGCRTHSVSQQENTYDQLGHMCSPECVLHPWALDGIVISPGFWEDA